MEARNERKIRVYFSVTYTRVKLIVQTLLPTKHSRPPTLPASALLPRAVRNTTDTTEARPDFPSADSFIGGNFACSTVCFSPSIVCGAAAWGNFWINCAKRLSRPDGFRVTSVCIVYRSALLRSKKG